MLPERDQLEKDEGQGTSVARVEKIASVIVGDCEGEEAWAAPDEVSREGKDRDILC